MCINCTNFFKKYVLDQFRKSNFSQISGLNKGVYDVFTALKCKNGSNVL